MKFLRPTTVLLFGFHFFWVQHGAAAEISRRGFAGLVSTVLGILGGDSGAPSQATVSAVSPTPLAGAAAFTPEESALVEFRNLTRHEIFHPEITRLSSPYDTFYLRNIYRDSVGSTQEFVHFIDLINDWARSNPTSASKLRERIDRINSLYQAFKAQHQFVSFRPGLNRAEIGYELERHQWFLDLQVSLDELLNAISELESDLTESIKDKPWAGGDWLEVFGERLAEAEVRTARALGIPIGKAFTATKILLLFRKDSVVFGDLNQSSDHAYSRKYVEEYVRIVAEFAPEFADYVKLINGRLHIEHDLAGHDYFRRDANMDPVNQKRISAPERYFERLFEFDSQDGKHWDGDYGPFRYAFHYTEVNATGGYTDIKQLPFPEFGKTDLNEYAQNYVRSLKLVDEFLAKLSALPDSDLRDVYLEQVGQLRKNMEFELATLPQRAKAMAARARRYRDGNDAPIDPSVKPLVGLPMPESFDSPNWLTFGQGTSLSEAVSMSRSWITGLQGLGIALQTADSMLDRVLEADQLAPIELATEDTNMLELDPRASSPSQEIQCESALMESRVDLAK